MKLTRATLSSLLDPRSSSHAVAVRVSGCGGGGGRRCWCLTAVSGSSSGSGSGSSSSSSRNSRSRTAATSATSKHTSLPCWLATTTKMNVRASSSNSIANAGGAATSTQTTKHLPDLYQVRGTIPSSPLWSDDDDDSGERGSNSNSSKSIPTLCEGQFGEVDWVYTNDMVMRYGQLVGDFNPLHQEWTQGGSRDDEPPPLVVVNSPLVRWRTEAESETDGGSTTDASHILVDQHSKNGEQDGLTTTSANITTRRKTVPLVHGMLVSSLFTCILGTLLPGAIYVNQTLEFRHPVYVGDRVRGRVTVTNLRRRQRPSSASSAANATAATGQRQNRNQLIVTCDTQVVVIASPSPSAIATTSPAYLEEDAKSESKEKVCVRGQATMLVAEGVVNI